MKLFHLLILLIFWGVLRAWCWNENNLRNANKRENFMSGMVGLFVRDSGVTLVGNLLQCAGIRIVLHTIWERSTCVTGRYEVIKWISLSLAFTEIDKSSDSLRNQIDPTFTMEKKTCSYRCCMCGRSFCFFFKPCDVRFPFTNHLILERVQTNFSGKDVGFDREYCNWCKSEAIRKGVLVSSS